MNHCFGKTVQRILQEKDRIRLKGQRVISNKQAKDLVTPAKKLR